MIILEGPDGGGKTTLLQRLCVGLAEYGIKEGKYMGQKNRDRMWETTVERTYSAIGADLNPNYPPIIWDRMFYSELVYAPIMGRQNAFGTRSNYVHRLITHTQSPVIFCMPPIAEVMKNVAKTKQHSWVAGNEEAIWKRYHATIARYSNENTYIWDYTADSDGTMNWAALVSNLRRYINKRRNIV